MASFVVLFLCMEILVHHFKVADCSSHWVVTEEGRIQSQLDSVFNLRKPYDLVAFIKQEERAVLLKELKRDLITRKDDIDRSEDRDTGGLEQKFYKTDPDCILAEKPLPDFDLYISTVLPLENKGIRPEEHIDFKSSPSAVPIHPRCTTVVDLDYSVHSFEHLEGIKDRMNLTATPELGLKNAITHRDNVDDYGHFIYEAMKKNKTSWVLFNMAAFYWRIKGDTYHAIECLRRALHYSPRMHKDVALISLANVLHRARYSNEAAIVVHAALDVSKELNVNHFTLGNIYAVLGEYNKSVICFENTLKIQPDFEAAAKRKHAVLCHAKLENALEAQHRSLQQTLNDLKDYQKKHNDFQVISDKLQHEQVSPDVKLLQRFAFEKYKIDKMNDERDDEVCRLVTTDGHQALLCTWRGKSRRMRQELARMMEGRHENESASENKADKPKKSRKSIPDYSKPVHPRVHSGETIIVPRFGYQAPSSPDWPSKEDCDTHVQKVPDPRNLSTVYLSPENRGFEVKAFLTESLKLKPGGEHPLPWYPPVCVPLLDIPEGTSAAYDHIRSVTYEERSKMPLKMIDASMKKTLVEHVNDGVVTEEEVGQRLLTAIKKNVGPAWILYNLAGLYWRVIGNNYHGIECIRRALYTVPEQYKDIPLVNLANILYVWGRYDDALKVVQDALKIDDIEPETHFLYGHLLWMTKNYTGAAVHYLRALQVQPEVNHAFPTLRALKCFMKYHQASQSAAPQETIAEPVGLNCKQKVVYNSNGQQTESRVICKPENGEDKCVIETRTRTKSVDCNGQCTQTCTITPIKVDTCGGAIRDLESAEGKTNSDDNSHCTQKGQSYPEDALFTSDFTTRLDEVSEYYQKKGLCQGEECNQLRVQCLTPVKTHTGLVAHIITPPKLFVRPVSLHSPQCMHGGQKPHVKLDYINGVLHQKLIFTQSPNELQIAPNDCFIFNDGSKSTGCSRAEYRAYKKSPFSDFEKWDELNRVFGDSDIDCVLVDDLESVEDMASSSPTKPLEESAKHEKRNGKKTKKRNTDTNDDLPDTTIHATLLHTLSSPTEEMCRHITPVDFSKFESTWLSVTAKGIRLTDYILFDSPIRGELMEPDCSTSFQISPTLQKVPGAVSYSNLKYGPERGLKQVLQNLSGEEEPIGVIGTRIALALAKRPASWILSNMAALYWRVDGDVTKAMDCLHVAINNSPSDMKDIAFISMANILFRSKKINDAIKVTNMALNASNNLAISHFNLANLYAKKGDWGNAILFYKSTLGLQSSFEPARTRLVTIYCQLLTD